LMAALALTALALPNWAAAGPFAATSLSPSTQTVTAGSSFTVDVKFAIGTTEYGTTYGIDARIDFDPSKLQVVSVTTGSGSPFINLLPGYNSVDNTSGILRYGATGPAASNVTYTVARIVFMPIAAGTSSLHLHEVNQYFTGYGRFGVDGSATSGSVTIVAPASTQTLTILGGSGNVGDIAANVEYFNPATLNWQPAYLADYAPYGHPLTHPWGTVPGTDHWINYRTDGASDPRASSDKSTYWYLYRVRIAVPADAQNATMTFSLKADNRAQVEWRSTVSTPGLKLWARLMA
jgi:hypothetical protein